MSDQPKAYIAGMGMITAVGADTAMTAAAVKAGASGHRTSEYYNHDRQPITLCLVPDAVFSSMTLDTEDEDYCSELYDRVIKMAILSVEEAISGQPIQPPIPLVLAMPEPLPHVRHIETTTLIAHLVNQGSAPVTAGKLRSLHTGRAAALQGLELAFRYLYEAGEDYVLLGGSDSHLGYARLNPLMEQQRLLAPGSKDGFAPGEGAGFLLLTRHPERALCRDHHIIALSQPGIAHEPGHLQSEEPYRGEGLDQAFKQALAGYSGTGIQAIYSSMNGEHYWAKEYGVAVIRNQPCFREKFKIEHPADCFGDLGAATGAVLLGLAAENLFKQKGPGAHLVYSSSDSAWRAAARLEKLPAIHNDKEIPAWN